MVYTKIQVTIINRHWALAWCLFLLKQINMNELLDHTKNIPIKKKKDVLFYLFIVIILVIIIMFISVGLWLGLNPPTAIS